MKSVMLLFRLWRGWFIQPCVNSVLSFWSVVWCSRSTAVWRELEKKCCTLSYWSTPNCWPSIPGAAKQQETDQMRNNIETNIVMCNDFIQVYFKSWFLIFVQSKCHQSDHLWSSSSHHPGARSPSQQNGSRWCNYWGLISQTRFCLQFFSHCALILFLYISVCLGNGEQFSSRCILHTRVLSSRQGIRWEHK